MNVLEIWQVLIFLGKNIIFPSSMNLWLTETKNGINNEEKMSLAALQFLDFQREIKNLLLKTNNRQLGKKSYGYCNQVLDRYNTFFKSHSSWMDR